MAQSGKGGKKVCVLVYVAQRVQDTGDQSGTPGVQVCRSGRGTLVSGRI